MSYTNPINLTYCAGPDIPYGMKLLIASLRDSDPEPRVGENFQYAYILTKSDKKNFEKWKMDRTNKLIT